MEERTQKKRRKRRKWFPILIGIFFAVLLAAGVICAIFFSDGSLGLFSGKETAGLTEEMIDDLQFSSNLSGEYFDLTVTDEEEAMDALDSMSFYYGYESAEDVYEAGYTQDTGLFTAYYFEQTYEGSPVVGHSMKVIVDDDGSVLNFSGNYVEISELSTEPSLDEAAAAAAAGIEDGDYTAQLCVYLPEEEAYLAWEIQYGYTEYYVDAQTGEVLEEVSLVSDFSESTAKSLTEKLYGQNQANGKLEVSIAYDESDGKYYAIDLDRKIYVYENITSSDPDLFTNSRLVSASAKTSLRVSAVDALFSIGRAYEFYEGCLGCTSFPYKTGARTTIYLGLDTAKQGVKNEDFTDNSGAYADVANNKVYIFFGPTSGTYDHTCCLGICTHEYTHAMQHFIIGAESYSSSEGGAIDEAIADIFGILCMAHYNNGQISWIIEDYVGQGRNIESPSLSPSSGGTYVETYDQYSDSVETHRASTLISHVAYTMNTQSTLGSDYAISDYQTLATLWYNAIYLMNAYSDLLDCRDAVVRVAEIMMAKGQLTEEQYLGVYLAFVMSGFPDSTVDTYIVNDSTEIEALVIDYNNKNQTVDYDCFSVTVQSYTTNDETDDDAYVATLNFEDGDYSFGDLVKKDSTFHFHYYVRICDNYTDEEIVLKVLYFPELSVLPSTLQLSLLATENIQLLTTFGSSSWISGKVKDEEGNPLSDVEVTLKNLDNWGQTTSVKTDSEGYYLLFLYYETEPFTLTFTKDWYEEDSFSSELTDPEPENGPKELVTVVMKRITIDAGDYLEYSKATELVDLMELQKTSYLLGLVNTYEAENLTMETLSALSQYSIWNTGNLFLTIYGMDTGDDMDTVHSTIESNGWTHPTYWEFSDYELYTRKVDGETYYLTLFHDGNGTLLGWILGNWLDAWEISY